MSVRNASVTGEPSCTSTRITGPTVTQMVNGPEAWCTTLVTSSEVIRATAPGSAPWPRECLATNARARLMLSMSAGSSSDGTTKAPSRSGPQIKSPAADTQKQNPRRTGVSESGLSRDLNMPANRPQFAAPLETTGVAISQAPRTRRSGHTNHFAGGSCAARRSLGTPPPPSRHLVGRPSGSTAFSTVRPATAVYALVRLL